MVMIKDLGSSSAKVLILLLWLLSGSGAWAQLNSESSSESMDQAPIAPQLEDLKQAALTLNRELLILEEELLYPASSQVAVYVSMDIGHFFALDAVRLEIDGQDRKSTRLNSSHVKISYAVFCLKKKNKPEDTKA